MLGPLLLGLLPVLLGGGGDWKVSFEHSDVLARRGDLGGALEIVEHILSTYSPTKKALFRIKKRKAELLTALNRHAEAEVVIHDMLSIATIPRKRVAHAHYMLGCCLLALSKMEASRGGHMVATAERRSAAQLQAAMHELGLAVELDATHADAKYFLALQHTKVSADFGVD